MTKKGSRGNKNHVYNLNNITQQNNEPRTANLRQKINKTQTNLQLFSTQTHDDYDLRQAERYYN